MSHTINLDFETIKQTIKDYLSQQAEFTDYDFEGSAMTVLVDAVAYAAHITALTANLVHSEAYLDSASIRKNVVSRAKELGYVPRSISSAVATVTLSVTPGDSPASITVSKGTKFTSTIDADTYTFVAMDDYTLLPIGGGVYEGNVTIAQGVLQKQTWIYDANNPVRFILTQADVDSNYISVTTKANSGATTIQSWTQADSMITLDPTSYAYFVQEAPNGNVEVYFGDGVISRAIVHNNVVMVEYLASKGSAANGADNFELISDVNGYSKSLFTVTTVDKASGGAAQEALDSIKWLAPKAFQAQRRTVTVADYRAILMNRYGWIDAINVWGGEDNIPPQYGRVFISIKPNYGLSLSPATKAEISSEVLDKFSIIGIIPEIVDPEYLYVTVASAVIYDKYKTTLSVGEIQTLAENAIDAFFLSSEGKFNNVVSYSKLVSAIDNSAASIVNNLSTITVSKKFTAVHGVKVAHTLNFGIPLVADSVESATWTGSDTVSVYQIKDNGDSKLYLYKNGVKQGTSIGTMDYDNGIAYITDFTPDVIINEIVQVFATPVESNIYVTGNNLIVLDSKTVSVQDLSNKIFIPEV